MASRALLGLSFAPLALLLLTPATARAGDAAAAQALFDDANRLLSQNRVAEACAKLEESQRQDPGIGTLYHLADCDERLGKTATAWATFRDVAAEATAQGEASRAAVARSRAAALEPKLARLTIDPGAESGTPGLQVVRDGVSVGSGEWMTAIPVDPGPHVVEVWAPRKGRWTTTVDATAGTKSVVTVPLLADLGAPAPPASVDAASTTSAEIPIGRRGQAQRVAGLVLGVAGLAGLGAGGYFGVASILHRNDSQPHCSGNVCDATGVADRNDAQQAGTASTIALSAGGAVLLAGIITYVTAPKGYRDPLPTAKADTRPTVAFGPGSVMLQGTW